MIDFRSWHFLTDVPTLSEPARSLVGWQPEQPGLLADIDHPAYFA
jgi:hypothetical protein